jgi:hypothetical protein
MAEDPASEFFYVTSESCSPLFWGTDSGDPQVTLSLHPEITELPPVPSQTHNQAPAEAPALSWGIFHLVCFLCYPIQFLMVTLVTAIKRSLSFSPLTDPPHWAVRDSDHPPSQQKTQKMCPLMQEWKPRALFEGTQNSNPPARLEPDISALKLPIDNPIVFAICLWIWDAFWIHAEALDSEWS